MIRLESAKPYTILHGSFVCPLIFELAKDHVSRDRLVDTYLEIFLSAYSTSWEDNASFWLGVRETPCRQAAISKCRK